MLATGCQSASQLLQDTQDSLGGFTQWYSGGIFRYMGRKKVGRKKQREKEMPYSLHANWSPTFHKFKSVVS